MYIRKIELDAIKSFSKKYTWELSGDDSYEGWHVILGRNGSGKSSFIKSAAVALSGPLEANKIRVNLGDWVTRGKDAGFIRVSIVPHKDYDKWAQRGNKGVKGKDGFQFSIKIQNTGAISAVSRAGDANISLWSGKPGWFSASYGPYRRFSGGSNDYQKLFYSAPLVARHLSVFGEDIALTETLEWLKELQFKTLENENSESAVLLKKVIDFINQDDLLPSGVKLQRVSSNGVDFIDSYGNTVSILELSDGYRSILSLMIELIRQMVSSYNTSTIFSENNTVIDHPGVVFIDEIDVHLHPSWQRKIGSWLTKHFPKIQFIVTTHSPLICQSATKGSVCVLPSHDDSMKGIRLHGEQYNKLVFGDVLDALGSNAFGIESSRSDESKMKMHRLAELNVRDVFEGLTELEREEQAALKIIFPMVGYSMPEEL